MSIRVDGVFDIETVGWDRFLCGEILTSGGERFVSWDEDDFYSELRSREGHFWGHNAGRFDSLWALGRAMERGDEPAISPRGAGILQLRIGRLILCDSAALWPDKLETVAEISDSPKLPFPLACTCGREGCKGYCALTFKLSPGEKRKVAEYLHGDCEALLASLLAVKWRLEDDGFDVRPTVGTTAWRTAKAWLDLPDCTHDLGTYKLIREGYQGGMTLPGVARYDSRAKRYDVHASYPAALARVGLPVGGAVVHETPRAARKAYLAGRHGTFQCRVRVPDMAYPPLGYRAGDRLLYPIGTFDGAWTAHELRYAEEECGVRILEVRSGVSFPRTEPVLAEFAVRVWNLREHNAASRDSKDNAYAKLLKWIANSLTGKVSQKETHEVYEYVPGQQCEDMAPVIRRGPHGFLLSWEGTRVPSCAHVEWGSTLVADARIELHRQIRHAEDVGRFLYCDTDSVYCTRALTRRVGDALGEWGHEGDMTGWLALAPKLYRYDCTGCKKHPQGGPHVRGKGMPELTDAGFHALAGGDAWVVDRGVLGLRQGLASDGPVFQRRKLVRRHTPVLGWIGGRILNSDATTRPPTVAEYEGR